MNWIDIADGGTRYELRGQGSRVLVLVHEMGGCIESWDPLLPLVASGRRILRVDTRGFGLATKMRGVADLDRLADDLLGVLDTLGIAEPVDICGMAVGGAIVARLAARHGDRVRSLGLMGPSLGIAAERRDAVRGRADAIEANGMKWISDDELGLTYPETLRGDGRFAEYRARWLGNDPSSYAATYRMLADLEMAGDLAAIDRPCLVLAGEFDPLRPPSLISKVATAISGARFAAVSAGHVMAFQSPEAVASQLHSFWDGAPNSAWTTRTTP